MSTIYEFSTGINIQRESNDRWCSVGFRGGWMLNTYGQDGIYEPLGNGGAYNIPYAIQQAYDNKEFSVGGTNRSQFTVAGRIIKLNNEEWSVVAFLTYASDERGRRVPTYRFFFSEGNSILDILRRIVTFEATSSNRLPVFHPSKITDLNRYEPADLSEINSKIVRNSNLEEDIKQSSGIRTHVLRENACLVDKSNALSLFNLNRLTLQRAAIINETGNQSWAYNADVLQRTETFILIQAADESAYRSLNNKRSGGIVKYQAGVDEQAIKNALKGLIEYENIDKTAGNDLKTIATAIQDPKVDEVYIRDIAKALGLTDYSLFNQTHAQLVKLHIVLSLFFPKVEEQLAQWKRLADLGWEEVIYTFPEKIKGYISQDKLANALKNANDKIKNFYYQNTDTASFDVREDVVWLLTKSLWANDVILDFFEQNVGLRLKIRTAFKELTENDKVDQTALDNLIIIANAIRSLQINETYISGVVGSLGLTDAALYNHPKFQVVKLCVLVNLFFPNVEKQLNQLRGLIKGSKLWRQDINNYTRDIQRYLIATPTLSYLFQDANKAIIKYCLMYIESRFTQERRASGTFNGYDKDLSEKVSSDIDWLLTESFWSNTSTKNAFESTINLLENRDILLLYDKYIRQPKNILTALRQLIVSKDIDPSTLEHLNVIIIAVREHKLDERYIQDIAASLILKSDQEKAKLDIIFSLFFPNPKVQLDQLRKYADDRLDQFVYSYIDKIKKYVIQSNLKYLIKNFDQEIIDYCFSYIRAEFKIKDILIPLKSDKVFSYVNCWLTKTLWSNQSTENNFNARIIRDTEINNIYEKHILQYQEILISLEDLIENENIEDINLDNLTVISSAIQYNVDEKYIRDIARHLGLVDITKNIQPNPKLVKLHILLSLFFPDIKKQLTEWQILTEKGSEEIITRYTKKIKEHHHPSQQLIEYANQEIINYCLEKIELSFKSRKLEHSTSDYIVWVLTGSLWASHQTLSEFEKTILRYVKLSFDFIDYSTSNPDDYFGLNEYLKNSPTFDFDIDDKQKPQYSFNWKLWDIVSIISAGEKVEDILKHSVVEPPFHYDQFLDILETLIKRKNLTFSSIRNFFSIVNKSFDKVFVSISLDPDDKILERLQLHSNKLDSLKRAKRLILINFIFSILFYVAPFVIVILLFYYIKNIATSFVIIVALLFASILVAKLIDVIRDLFQPQINSNRQVLISTEADSVADSVNKLKDSQESLTVKHLSIRQIMELVAQFVRKKKNLLFLIVGVGVAIAVIGGAFFASQNSISISNNTSPQSPSPSITLASTPTVNPTPLKSPSTKQTPQPPVVKSHLTQQQIDNAVSEFEITKGFLKELNKIAGCRKRWIDVIDPKMEIQPVSGRDKLEKLDDKPLERSLVINLTHKLALYQTSKALAYNDGKITAAEDRTNAALKTDMSCP